MTLLTSNQMAVKRYDAKNREKRRKYYERNRESILKKERNQSQEWKDKKNKYSREYYRMQQNGKSDNWFKEQIKGSGLS